MININIRNYVYHQNLIITTPITYLSAIYIAINLEFLVLNNLSKAISLVFTNNGGKT